MSVTDPMTEPVQPDEGQGGEGGAPPYQEWLDRIPEEVRGDVEPIFKEWDANTTRRFQEASEYRKTWEPYEQLGVNRLSPQEVEWHLRFNEALSNPQAIKQWYEAYGAEHGLIDQQQPEPAPQQQQQQQQQQPGGFDEWGNPVADSQQLEQLLQKQLSPMAQQLEALSQWREQQEYQTRFAEAQRYVQSQIDELKQKHPSEFNEAAIEKLVAQYIETDPANAVQRAFDDWQQIRGQIEKAALAPKVNPGVPPESGGIPDTAPEDIKTLKQAGEYALARLREANRAG